MLDFNGLFSISFLTWKGGASGMEILLTLIESVTVNIIYPVIAAVIAHYVCKWIDSAREDR